AEKKDKAARKAALMIQKMKQDMQAEKAALQAQFDAEKAALAAQLTDKTAALAALDESFNASEAKARNLAATLKRTTDEKTLLSDTLSTTQATLSTTQSQLADLTALHKKAVDDLAFNDSQRKTLASNMSETTKTLNSCEAKNAQLYAYGKELVRLYDDPSLYEAVMRKEKFFQLKRVELENILQAQQDKLDEARVTQQKSPF
ncbi:MAG TPA: hypothetical protein VGD04_09475, partial [Methylophilus sp.]